MNTRKIGKKLENYTCGSLSRTDKKCKLTNNSGAVSNNGDILHKNYVIECKKRNTESVSIKRNIWLKLCASIPIGSQKSPLLVLENSYGEKWAVLQLDDFVRINSDKLY